MFNVCPGCGQYEVEREIDTTCDAVLCSACGHKHSFVKLPLLVITGASCTGKTTVGLQLPARLPQFVCLDSDILWRDEFNQPTNDYNEFRNLWLRMAKNIAQGGRSLVLIGTAAPGQFESCPERRYVGDIHYLAYVCDDDELTRRLKARPSWRQSGTDEVVGRMLDFNNWLKQQSGIGLLDTTSIGVDETVARTVDWAAERAL